MCFTENCAHQHVCIYYWEVGLLSTYQGSLQITQGLMETSARLDVC